MSHLNSKKGFTLIELLVVIAIIAILAAILFPVFAKVREKARQTSCLSNEKQLGLAVMQYIEDYDEHYPIGEQSIGGPGWAGQIYSYVKSNGAYVCPDDQIAMESYGLNENLIMGANLAGDHTPDGGSLSDAVLTSPSRTVLIGETAECGSNYELPNYVVPNPAAGVFPTENTSPAITGLDYSGWDGGLNVAGGVCTSLAMGLQVGGVNENVGGRHTGASNVLLADDHVKYLQPGRISPGFTAFASTNDQTAKGWTSSGVAAGTDFSGTSAITGGSFDATFSPI